MIAYKVFDPDWKCKGFQYKVGETFVMKNKPSICNIGIHACTKLIDCFNYYSFNPENKVAEVKILGDIDKSDNDSKIATNKILIVKELSWPDVLDMVNSGDANSGYANSGDKNSGNENSGSKNSGNENSGNENSGNENSGNENSGNENSGNENSGNENSGNENSGDFNSGDANSGDKNSGNENSGNFNSGNENSGNFNSGDKNSGYANSGDFNSGRKNSGECNKGNFHSGIFNTGESKISIFNQLSSMTLKEYFNSNQYIPFDIKINKWVYFENMSENEKKENPKASSTGGYLKTFTYEEAWANWWKINNNSKMIEKIKKLPNFDAAIFKEITGIEII